MKKRIKNTLLGILSVGLMLSATVGVATGIPVSADSVRVKPTGLNENTLTAEIKDTMLDTFKVYGASTRTAEPAGFRFLTTIEQSDLELIPNDAEFGTLIIPYNKLGENELTKDTENALVAPALVDTGAEDVPANGLGYYITLMGETLEDAFPENLYNSVLAARAYVKYTYTVDGEEITDYAYSATTIYRSIAYVASCELVEKQEAGEDVSNSSYLNAIISQTTESASLSIPAEMTAGSTKKITLENATDGVNQFAYILTSSNEEVAVINNNGEVEAVGAGTATITAKIGTKEVSTQITVTSTEFTAGNILYSTADGKIFMPDGLLDGENETIVSAVGTEDSVDYFDNGKWNALALTETEITANAVRETNLSIKTSDGDFYTVNALSYAGVIDELSDFPAFFNNTAVPSEFDATQTAVAPNVYGYYIVTKNLGTGSEELAFTQTEATDYNAANGFNGVLDGQGHKLQFTLTSGGLVGMILGNATIKNLAVSFTDNTSGHYGVFGYRAGGHTVIENCYIERVNNPYTRTTIYGIIACTNRKLELRNTVVHGGNMSNNADWYSNMYISESSTNAFLIYARAAAPDWGISANFTEIAVSTNTLTSDLSSMDTNYWNTANNAISWKGLANMSVSVYEEKYVQSVDEKAMYSTQDGEIFLPENWLSDGETIVDVVDANGVDYYENDAWQNLALTTDEINANATRSTTVIVETSMGYYYELTVVSYAGVIDELSDFPAFFNNTAVPNEADNAADVPMVAPDTYGYYVVAKDLGSITDELTLTQTALTNYQKTNGFNGVLDGQGHTLQFKLMSGGLVGLIIGNGTIKNLAVIYEDASFISQNEGGGYGAFGYFVCGAPVIDNCYIERTNNVASRSSVFGIMGRPNTRLVVKNSVVYGFNVPNDCTWWTNNTISASSTNVYVIHGRTNAASQTMATNFTKVYTDALEDGSREVLIPEIIDVNSFDDNYWYKENGKLIWKGLETVSITWVNGEETVVETATKGDYITVPELDETMYWAAEDSSDALASPIRVNEDKTYYAYSLVRELEESVLYSTISNEIFLPTVIGSDMSEVVSITSADESIVYYENGAWSRSFALTSAQMQANEVGETAIKVTDGTFTYYTTVKSYAGVIDELSDFPVFFDNDPTATAPDVYGYYIVTKSLGTGSEELALTQSETTDYRPANGFNGVLDGAGHTLKFTLTSGGLVGMILGHATIKNLSVEFTDSTTGMYGVFGYRAGGNTKIENCYIKKVNNNNTRYSIYGIIGCTNKNLELHNTMVWGSDTTRDGDMLSNMYISSASTNAFLAYARTDKGAESWNISQNFTELLSSNIPSSDLSSFDRNCWTVESNNRLTWKGMEDMAVNCVGELVVQAKNLAENGATSYAIVLPTNADATLTLAKDELVSFFAEATGATLTVASDIAYDTYGAYISIGDTQTFANSGVAMGEMNSQGYHLQTVNNTIYINANSSVGCLYGVYGLLGELFGYEQYSEDTYALNALSLVELPSLNKTESPDIAMRMPSNSALVNNTEYANRMGMAMGELDYLYRVGDYTNNGGAGWTVWHNAFEILPPSYWKEQGKTNWFSDDGTQLCYTAHGNTDDYNAMVAQIAVIMQQTLTSSQITNKPDAVYYTLTSEDTETSCTCSACQSAKTTYGSDVGAVIKLCNDVQATVAEWMNQPDNAEYKRDITLLFFAYNNYVDAPTADTITMREDVGVMYAISDYVNYYYDIKNAENDEFRAQFDAWAALTKASGSDFAVWTYTKNFQMYMLRADVYGENAFFNENAYQYFAEKGVDFWFNQGAWNGTTTLSTFEKLNGYIDAQMMWDSTQSVTTLTNNWFTAMYGVGAEYMKSLYTAQNAKAREVYGTTKLGIPSVAIDKDSMKDILTETIFNEWFGYIDSAKSAVNADANLTDTEKAKMIEHINEEWISVKFLYIYLYYSSFLDGLDGVTVDVDAAKAEFRAVLGYDSSTGTYAKDVVLLENAGCTLVEFIESDFTASV